MPGSTIDISTAPLLARWAGELCVPPEALQAAVAAVGPKIDDVMDYLVAGSAGEQEDG